MRQHTNTMQLLQKRPGCLGMRARASMDCSPAASSARCTGTSAAAVSGASWTAAVPPAAAPFASFVGDSLVSFDLRPANIPRDLEAFLEGETVAGLRSGSDLAATAAPRSSDGADARLSSVTADDAMLLRETRPSSSEAAACTCDKDQAPQLRFCCRTCRRFTLSGALHQEPPGGGEGV